MNINQSYYGFQSMSKERKDANVEPDYVRCSIEVKAVGDPEDGIIEGYASIFSVKDLHDDIIDPGAFAKTISERVPAGKVKLFDTHQWDSQHMLGTVIEAKEDSRGLWFKGQLSNAPSVQDIRLKMLEGHITEASIGFDSIRERFEDVEGRSIRHIEELKLWEVSVVPFGANEHTRISAKSVPNFKDLELVEIDHKPTELKGVERWNPARIKKAYLWYNKKDPGNSDYQIASIVGDQLKAVPELVIKSAEKLHAGDSRLSEIESDEIKKHISKYYKKMRAQFKDETILEPWDQHENYDEQKEVEELVKSFKELPDDIQAKVLKELTAEPDMDPLTGTDINMLELKARELEVSMNLINTEVN